MSESSDVLRGPHILEYPYKRSLGPVLSRFFTSLRDRQFEGIRARDGKVLVPPQEYDPHIERGALRVGAGRARRRDRLVVLGVEAAHEAAAADIRSRTR